MMAYGTRELKSMANSQRRFTGSVRQAMIYLESKVNNTQYDRDVLRTIQDVLTMIDSKEELSSYINHCFELKNLEDASDNERMMYWRKQADYAEGRLADIYKMVGGSNAN